MITCRELVDFLTDYVEDELPRPERQRFDEHLGACPECVDYVDSYRTTIELGQLLCTDDSPPPEMPEELTLAILAARRTRESPTNSSGDR